MAADRGVNDQRLRFAGEVVQEVVHYAPDPGSPVPAQGVSFEVHAPAPVSTIRQRHQGRKLLRMLNAHAAVLRPPAVEGPLADPMPSANLRRRQISAVALPASCYRRKPRI